MEKAEITVLAGLPPGHRGTVLFLGVRGPVRRRLLDLGLVPGTLVEAIRKSPTGDPVAYKIRGAVIALRLAEGRKVFVQRLQPP